MEVSMIPPRSRSRKTYRCSFLRFPIAADQGSENIEMDLDPSGDIQMRFLVRKRAGGFWFGAEAASHSNCVEAFFHPCRTELKRLPSEQELT